MCHNRELFLEDCTVPTIQSRSRTAAQSFLLGSPKDTQLPFQGSNFKSRRERVNRLFETSVISAIIIV